MTTAKRPASGAADPWWGDATDTEAVVDFDAPVVSDRPRRSAPRSRRVRTRAPWWLRLLRLPFTLFVSAVRRSPKLRKLLVRLAIVGIVAVGIAGSVGVILLNNVVIHRTAELGKLDQERRELRRDNAVLDAQAARESAQPVISRRAERELGMKRTFGAPNYTYLDPQSSDVVAKRKAALAAKARQRAEAQERIAQAAAPTKAAR